MKSKRNVLFICVHNSGRSLMAEAFLNLLAGDRFYAESAGFKPTAVYPPVIEVMREEGIDLSGKKTKNVFEFYKQGRLYDFVITVCDESAENQCPVFPGIVKRLNWPFPDPEKAAGTPEEKLAEIRKTRDSIKAQIKEWLKEFQD